MTDPNPPEEATLFPKTAGEKLREAREAQGLSLAEIAARTRVPVRQLEAIEVGNYAALPSITYSVGFAKAYARAVDLDEVAIAREVRGASDQPGAVRRTEYEAYEIDEPSRVPTRGLAIGALIVAVLLLVGIGLFYGTALFRGEESAPVPVVENKIEAAPAPATVATPSVPTGAVVLTATDEVWLKVYDAAGKTLFLGTLKAGEVYAVPADATAPLINVGRPDKLQITVGGTPVAPLGDGRVAIKDVAIDAASLTARAAPTAAATQPIVPAVAPSTAPTASPSRPTARATPRASRAIPSGSAPLNIAAPVPVASEPVAPAPGSTPTP
ncbi:RodZ domain-containing protein [Sphingomonas sp.]|uniref:helix-turn-helix domain-containing protein n=1 Tax=Sphingomonas sp. TaxID=28214 RepID=UPI003341600F